MIRAMLTHLGYSQVTFAADGADALFQYNTFKLDGKFFDIILLDSSLPTLPGDDTCVRIRQHDRTQVIISCTASTHLVNDPELRRALGYDEAMTKPFYLDGLKDVWHGATAAAAMASGQGSVAAS
ncbi:hypothetical protein BCR44DRAFT_1437141 [Catenaria anguillulae PL171]|uniref:Response regulatory domain-containing protein n=1 Tax=Catenaria anguillulae PL171 TaxID=765915 RepID=A0A1Y2HHP3_9FUNG|nr:hypothetical protein BCR44DRAFT_1437141 [Catenaria anguillulae PL171]